MGRLTSHNRKYLIAGAAVLVVAGGGFGFVQFYPPKGPTQGTISPAQRYVESLAEGDIPARGRYVLVDAASARLFMIEDGKVRDTMKVIVGKPASATPEIKSTIYYATLNPYWNVPPDLARTIIAPLVLKYGDGYLKFRGYEVVTSFSGQPKVLPSDSVNWQDVASGKTTIKVRQRPGPSNSMGVMKFNLSNANGIYLHDTPHKELFAKQERNISNGCVRLEDASKLARWLFGKDPSIGDTVPEQQVPIPGAVPISIAYLGSGAQTQLASLQAGAKSPAGTN